MEQQKQEGLFLWAGMRERGFWKTSWKKGYVHRVLKVGEDLQIRKIREHSWVGSQEINQCWPQGTEGALSRKWGQSGVQGGQRLCGQPRWEAYQSASSRQAGPHEE